MEFGYLVVIKKGKVRGPYELHQGVHRIGHSMHCEIRLKINNPLLLATHATIRVLNNGAAIMFNKSTGAPVKINEKNALKPTILKHEDKFEILDKHFQYFNEKLKDEPEDSQIYVEATRHILQGRRRTVHPLIKTPAKSTTHKTTAGLLNKSWSTSRKSLNKNSHTETRRSLATTIQKRTRASMTAFRFSHTPSQMKKEKLLLKEEILSPIPLSRAPRRTSRLSQKQSEVFDQIELNTSKTQQELSQLETSNNGESIENAISEHEYVAPLEKSNKSTRKSLNTQQADLTNLEDNEQSMNMSKKLKRLNRSTTGGNKSISVNSSLNEVSARKSLDTQQADLTNLEDNEQSINTSKKRKSLNRSTSSGNKSISVNSSLNEVSALKSLDTQQADLINLEDNEQSMNTSKNRKSLNRSTTSGNKSISVNSSLNELSARKSLNTQQADLTNLEDNEQSIDASKKRKSTTSGNKSMISVNTSLNEVSARKSLDTQQADLTNLEDNEQSMNASKKRKRLNRSTTSGNKSMISVNSSLNEVSARKSLNTQQADLINVEDNEQSMNTSNKRKSLNRSTTSGNKSMSVNSSLNEVSARKSLDTQRADLTNLEDNEQSVNTSKNRKSLEEILSPIPLSRAPKRNSRLSQKQSEVFDQIELNELNTSKTQQELSQLETSNNGESIENAISEHEYVAPLEKSNKSTRKSLNTQQADLTNLEDNEQSMNASKKRKSLNRSTTSGNKSMISVNSSLNEVSARKLLDTEQADLTNLVDNDQSMNTSKNRKSLNRSATSGNKSISVNSSLNNEVSVRKSLNTQQADLTNLEDNEQSSLSYNNNLSHSSRNYSRRSTAVMGAGDSSLSENDTSSRSLDRRSSRRSYSVPTIISESFNKTRVSIGTPILKTRHSVLSKARYSSAKRVSFRAEQNVSLEPKDDNSNIRKSKISLDHTRPMSRQSMLSNNASGNCSRLSSNLNSDRKSQISLNQSRPMSRQSTRNSSRLVNDTTSSTSIQRNESAPTTLVEENISEVEEDTSSTQFSFRLSSSFSSQPLSSSLDDDEIPATQDDDESFKHSVFNNSTSYESLIPSKNHSKRLSKNASTVSVSSTDSVISGSPNVSRNPSRSTAKKYSIISIHSDSSCDDNSVAASRSVTRSKSAVKISVKGEQPSYSSDIDSSQANSRETTVDAHNSTKNLDFSKSRRSKSTFDESTRTNVEQSSGSALSISSHSFSSFKKARSDAEEKLEETEIIDVVNITAESSMSVSVSTPVTEERLTKGQLLESQMFDGVTCTSTPFHKLPTSKNIEKGDSENAAKRMTRSKSQSSRKTENGSDALVISSMSPLTKSLQVTRSRSSSSSVAEVILSKRRSSSRRSISRNGEHNCISCNHSSVTRSRSLSASSYTATANKSQNASVSTPLSTGEEAVSPAKRMSTSIKAGTPLLQRKSVISLSTENTPKKSTSAEDETPKSHIKTMRRSSEANQSTYNPVVEDITPVTPDKLQVSGFTEEVFKTPVNTPGLFESIRKSVIRSRKRDRETTGGAAVDSKRARVDFNEEEDKSKTPAQKTSPVVKERKQRSPLNRLSNFEGVKKLLKTPPKSPKNDLRNVPNLRRIMSPKQQNSPKNDLTNPIGVKKLLRSPKNQKLPVNDLTDVSGVAMMFNVSGVETPHHGSDIENYEDLFTQLTGKKAVKAYSRGKSVSPNKTKTLGEGMSRKTMGDLPVCSPRVQQWVEDHVAYVSAEKPADIEEGVFENIMENPQGVETSDNEGILLKDSLEVSLNLQEKSTPNQTLEQRKSLKPEENTVSGKETSEKEDESENKRSLRKRPKREEQEVKIEVLKRGAGKKRVLSDDDINTPIKTTREITEVPVENEVARPKTRTRRGKTQLENLAVADLEIKEVATRTRHGRKDVESDLVTEDKPARARTRRNVKEIENNEDKQDGEKIAAVSSARGRRARAAPVEAHEELVQTVETIAKSPVKRGGRKTKRNKKPENSEDNEIFEEKKDVSDKPEPITKKTTTTTRSRKVKKGLVDESADAEPNQKPEDSEDKEVFEEKQDVPESVTKKATATRSRRAKKGLADEVAQAERNQKPEDSENNEVFEDVLESVTKKATATRSRKAKNDSVDAETTKGNKGKPRRNAKATVVVYEDDDVVFTKPLRSRRKKPAVVESDNDDGVSAAEVEPPKEVAKRSKGKKNEKQPAKPKNKIIEEVTEIDVDSPRATRAKRGTNKKYPADDYEVPKRKVHFDDDGEKQTPEVPAKRTLRARK